MANESQAPDPQPNEKFFHLMDGLLYPAVVGAGLVVLAMRAADSHRTDDYFAARMSLGLMTLCIYCASYVAFKDVHEKAYSVWLFLLDLAEVAVVFTCYLWLGLLDITVTEGIPLPRVFAVLAVDLLPVQIAWRGFASKSVGTAFRYWYVRLLLLAVLGVGFACGYPAVAGWVVIAVVAGYEFALRDSFVPKKDGQLMPKPPV
jgi:hypothetical protein